MKPPFSDDPKLNQLLALWRTFYDGLSPSERKAEDRRMAINFIYGNLTCTGRRPYITRELVEQEYDKKHT